MYLGGTERFRVAAAVGGHDRLEHDHAATHLDDAKRVLVAMRVDANDVIHLICNHPY